MMYIHGARVPCQLMEIISRVDKSGNVIGDAQSIAQGSTANVIFKASKPIFLDPTEEIFSTIMFSYYSKVEFFH